MRCPVRRPVQRRTFRVVGRGVAQKRAQMEAGWRTWIEEVCRCANSTTTPSVTPSCAATLHRQALANGSSLLDMLFLLYRNVCMGYMAVVERNPAEMRYRQQLMVKAGSKCCAECLQALETRGGAESGTVRFVNSTAHPCSDPGDCSPCCACPPQHRRHNCNWQHNWDWRPLFCSLHHWRVGSRSMKCSLRAPF